MKRALWLAGVLIFLPALSWGQGNQQGSIDARCTQPSEQACVDWNNGLAIAVGSGAPATWAKTAAQKNISATRAARLDAARNLMELIKGVNLNTAPPHVLATLYYDDGVGLRLADEDLVRDILKIRQDGGIICSPDHNIDGCTPVHDLVANAIFPAPTYSTQVFLVKAEARVGQVRRTVEATIDRSDPAVPRLLSWRVR